jgi:hypothetical protein
MLHIGFLLDSFFNPEERTYIFDVEGTNAVIVTPKKK